MEYNWHIKFVMNSGYTIDALYKTKLTEASMIFNQISEYQDSGKKVWLVVSSQNYGEIVSVKLSDVVAIQLSLPDGEKAI